MPAGIFSISFSKPNLLWIIMMLSFSDSCLAELRSKTIMVRTQVLFKKIRNTRLKRLYQKHVLENSE